MRSRLRYALVTLIERNFLRKRRRDGREEFEFVKSDVRADVYGLLPVLTRQRLHGFAADFFDEDFVRAHHLVHAGTSRSPEKALIAVGERCSAKPETRPEAILAYSLLLHVELSGQGSCGSPAYAALLKPASVKTGLVIGGSHQRDTDRSLSTPARIITGKDIYHMLRRDLQCRVCMTFDDVGTDSRRRHCSALLAEFSRGVPEHRLSPPSQAYTALLDLA